MIIRLFGITTSTGSFLLNILEKEFDEIYCYSRTNKFKYLDMTDENIDRFVKTIKDDEIWINLSPIWLFARFINSIKHELEPKPNKIKGIITCSSSSILTKKYSWHKYDKDLVSNLEGAEMLLIDICDQLDIFLSIIRPTMIYGKFNNYKDKNISRIEKICSKLPFIVLPNKTGFRQPISIKQLAKIIKHKLNMIINIDSKVKTEIINIGGDEIVSYSNLIKLIIKKNKFNCRIICIPQCIFLFIFSPFLLINTRLYSEIMRISSNLSGFKKSSEFLSSKKEFIVENL